MRKTIYIPSNAGDLLDKISILNIKRIMLTDLDKLVIVKKELIELMDIGSTFLENPEIEKLHDTLTIVNKNLWDVEDSVRQLDSDKIFDDEFIGKARSVYRLNDRRHQIKNEINNILDFEIKEVKQYPTYQ
jgi:hypothetical protein